MPLAGGGAPNRRYGRRRVVSRRTVLAAADVEPDALVAAALEA
ncbi:MAG TPA: hypothetical protein VN651_17110 [Gemmatimonadaceae bacterium]|nr:hypothetical protein [Gemmatimonadaceae bacterium]